VEFIYYIYREKGQKEKNHVAVVQWVDFVLCVSVASKWAAKGTPWC